MSRMSLAARTLVAEIEAMAGNVAAALRTVRSDDEKGYRQSALQRVVSARAIAGDVTGALRICLDECKTAQERLSALEGLGRGVETRLSQKWLEPRQTRRASAALSQNPNQADSPFAPTAKPAHLPGPPLHQGTRTHIS